MIQPSKFAVLAFGETLWDHLGPNRFPGGAATNLLLQVIQSGHQGVLVSAVAADDAGIELLTELEKRGLNTSYVQKTSAAATGAVFIHLDPAAKPIYQCNREAAFDHIETDSRWGDRTQKIDAIFFTALVQRHENTFQTCQYFLNKAGDVFKLFDCNIRGWNDSVATMVQASLAKASALKLNRAELRLLQDGLGQSEADPADFIDFLQTTFDLIFVAVTLGPDGALLKFRSQDLIRQPAFPIAPVDTTGAGDAFAAALLVSFLQGHEPEIMLKQANLLAAFNCTRPGAVPQWQPPEFASFARIWSNQEHS